MRTFLFASKSDPSAPLYKTRTHNDGTIVDCTCRGYRMRNVRACIHTRTVTEAFATNTVSTLQEQRDLLETLEPATLFAGGLLAEILEAQPGDPPGFVLPMLASALPADKTVEDYADGGGWILEEKYDGHRLIVRVSRHDHEVRVIAWSRAGNVRVLPTHIVVNAQRLASGTYDGELYLPGGTSTDVTRTDADVQTNLRLVLFDLIYVDGMLVTQASYERRNLLVVAGSALLTDVVSVAPQFPVSREGLQAIWDRGGEGAIIKHYSATYRPGKRIKEWVKFKKFAAAEIVITGFIAGSLGPCSVIVGTDQHGIEVRAKARNDAWRASFEGDPTSYIGRTLVIEHQGMAAKGKYKHPMADHLL